MRTKIEKLNELLTVLSNVLRQNNIVEPERINQLITQTDTVSIDILNFDEEFKNNIDLFLNFSENRLNEINLLEKLGKELKSELQNSITNSDFEQAAQIRDKRNLIRLDIKNKVIDLNEFKQGFNLFNEKLLIVKPSDIYKGQILEAVINRKKTNANKSYI